MPFNRRSNRRFRRDRFIKKQAGGKAKAIIDGHKAGFVSTNPRQAIPYLIKSVNFMRNQINSEYKYIDTVTTLASVLNTGTVTYLSGIAQGITDITRVGNKILIKDILVRLQITHNPAGSVPSSMRIIFFASRQVNGVLPTIAEVLQSASQLSPLNRDNTKQYVILKDYLFSTIPATETDIMVRKFYKIVNWHAFYDGTTNAIGDAEENHLFFLAISDVGADGPELVVDSRIKFYDS